MRREISLGDRVRVVLVLLAILALGCGREAPEDLTGGWTMAESDANAGEQQLVAEVPLALAHDVETGELVSLTSVAWSWALLTGYCDDQDHCRATAVPLAGEPEHWTFRLTKNGLEGRILKPGNPFAMLLGRRN